MNVLDNGACAAAWLPLCEVEGPDAGRTMGGQHGTCMRSHVTANGVLTLYANCQCCVASGARRNPSKQSVDLSVNNRGQRACLWNAEPRSVRVARGKLSSHSKRFVESARNPLPKCALRQRRGVAVVYSRPLPPTCIPLSRSPPESPVPPGDLARVPAAGGTAQRTSRRRVLPRTTDG